MSKSTKFSNFARKSWILFFFHLWFSTFHIVLYLVRHFFSWVYEKWMYLTYAWILHGKAMGWIHENLDLHNCPSINDIFYTANMYSGRAVEKHFFAVILRKKYKDFLAFLILLKHCFFYKWKKGIFDNDFNVMFTRN